MADNRLHIGNLLESFQNSLRMRQMYGDAFGASGASGSARLRAPLAPTMIASGEALPSANEQANYDSGARGGGFVRPPNLGPVFFSEAQAGGTTARGSVDALANNTAPLYLHGQSGQSSANIEDRRGDKRSRTDILLSSLVSVLEHDNRSNFVGQPKLTDDVIDTIIAEAGSDPDGQAAVAHVILNRARQTGKTPDQVVKEKGQFQGYSNPGSGSKQAQKIPSVRAAAESAFNGAVSGTIPDPTNGGVSFRSKGTKQSAPHGTVTIGGNTFALGSAKPSSAVAAINEVAPLPAPAPLRATAYAPSVPKVRAISVNTDGTLVAPSAVAPSSKPVPDLQSALNAMAGRRAAPPIPQSRPAFAPPQALPSRAQIVAEAGSEQRANRSATPVPPPPTPLISRPVTTVKIDPYTGNPVDPRGTTQDAANREAVRLASQRAIPPVPAAPPIKVGMGPTPAQQKVIDGGYYAMHPDERPSPPAVPGITAAQRNAIASVGNYQPDIIRNVPPPAPIRTASTINAATPLDGNLLGLSPVAPKPPALAAIDAAVQLPRIRPQPPAQTPLTAFAPMPHQRPLTAAPAVPIALPRAPARIPLSSIGGVNPMSQIIPGLQAHFNTTGAGHIMQALTGQPIQGGLLAMLLNGRQPQAQQPMAAPRIPEQAGFNGTTQVTNDQLAGGNGSIFSTNTVLPDSMNSERWQTGYGSTSSSSSKKK